jgi:hypothetical protein
LATDLGLRPTILVAARDEEDRIGETVRGLRATAPGAEIIVADDGSRDRTADRAEAAGAVVLRLPRRGKGEALSAAERAAPPGPLLLCDADLRGDLRPLLKTGADLAIARFAGRRGGGFGVAKTAARALVRWLSGFEASEPLSGQRSLTPAARSACFPLAAGFGCETRMTLDAVRAGLVVRELELKLEHRPTGRDLAGFAHRGRQLHDVLLACGPLAVNYRGVRLPLVGWAVALGGTRGQRSQALAVAAVAGVGLADDLRSGPERGWAQHLRARRTTGVLKLVAIPALGAALTGSFSGGLLVGLAANALNQLDTRPGRALKAFLVAGLPLRRTLARAYVPWAVLLAPYDLRERAMLGDAGSNALGAVLGLSSVTKLRGRARWAGIAALVGFNFLGERRSLGKLIDSTPLLRDVDRLGTLR